MALLSLRLSPQCATNDVYFDILGSPSDLALTWPEVKFWPWPFKVNLYMVRRALTRQTRWNQNRCSTFQIKDFIVQNRFGKLWNFDPWWPQFWPEPKKDRNDFEMIFRKLSNSVFRFVLRCAGVEIDGGGACVQTPPSRWWKIQRPSRARVNQLIYLKTRKLHSTIK